MSVGEEAVLLPAGAGLAGILTLPGAGPRSGLGLAALLLNAGLVYRIGPNRHYVALARHLAGQGIPTLRLDFSGIGDSPPRSDRLQFEDSAPIETSRAMDWMSERLDAQRFLLLGICSGARVGFRAALEDDRVVGVALLNPRSLGPDERNELRELASSYQTLRAVRQPKLLRRVLAGQVDYLTAARNLMTASIRMSRRRAAHHQASDIVAAVGELLERGVELGFFFAEGEFGRIYLRLALGSEYDSVMADPRVKEYVIPLADHTFTWPSSQDSLFDAIGRWTATWSGADATSRLIK